jgi:hypothetical protein
MHGQSEDAQQSDALLGEVIVGLDEILTADLEFHAGAEGIDIGSEAGSLAVFGQLPKGLGGIQLGGSGFDLTFGGDDQQITGGHRQGDGLFGGVEGESGSADIGGGGAGVLDGVKIDEILGHGNARVRVAELHGFPDIQAGNLEA